MSAILAVLIVAGLVVLALLVTGVLVAVRLAHRAGPLPVSGSGPRKGTPAEVWLRRGERTARSLHDQVEQGRGRPIAAQLSDVDATSSAVLADLRRVSSQTASVENALFGIDAPRLREQHADPAGSVAEQLAIAERLQAVRTGLLGRMETTVVGLEGLGARLAEVLALADTTGGVDQASDRIGELSDQLEGLRRGLAETEQLSQGALRALPPAGGAPRAI